MARNGGFGFVKLVLYAMVVLPRNVRSTTRVNSANDGRVVEYPGVMVMLSLY